MPQSVLLKASGLYTFDNSLSEIPRGGLIQADNVIINRESVIEPRRGFKIYGDVASSAIKQIMFYKDKILRHYGTIIDFDNGSGTFTAFTGSFTEAETGLRTKSVESNGNLYFTTNSGIKKISSDGGITASDIGNAGMVAALDIQATLNDQEGFFLQESKVAYRVLWGIEDNNENLILGAPSEQVVISNPLSTLLAKDFNSLLKLLDTASSVSGGDDLSDTDYFSSLNLSIYSSSTLLKTKLSELCEKLAADLSVDSGPTSVTVDASTNTFTTATVHGFIQNQIVYLTGTTAPSGTSFNTPYYISSPTADTFKLSLEADGETLDFITTGTTVSVNYSKTKELQKLIEDLNFSANPTTEQLEQLQSYYNELILILNSYIGTKLSSSISQFSTSVTSSTVDLEITIPEEITESYFFQVYRSAVIQSTGVSALADIDVGDELALVYESYPTTDEITAGYIRIQDITPDDFRGANLYTNPNSGEGILQANFTPPKAKDITLYKNYLFFGNTETKFTKNLSLLSVDDFVDNTSTFKITDGTTLNTYTFVIPESEITTITTIADVADSLNGDYFTLNSAKDQNQYYVWYKTSGGAESDPAISGKTGIKVSITTGDSATNVALATKSALDNYTEFAVTLSGSTLRVSNTSVGICTDAIVGTSGFSISVVNQGVGEDYTNKKIEYNTSLFGNINTTGSTSGTTTKIRTDALHGLKIGQIVTISGSNSTPSIDGNFVIIDVPASDEFTIDFTTSSAPTAGSWEVYPALSTSQQVDACARSLVRVVNRNDSELVYAFYLSSETDVPGQIRFESREFGGSAFYLQVGNSNISGEFNPSLPTSGSTVIASNEVRPNRIFYSKQFQPDAVPLVNYFDVGPKDKKILRLLSLRESLFIFKEEGVYRLSGESAPFVVALFDSSALLTAPDTATVLNNTIYMLSDQGVAQTSDTGVAIISRSIEGDLLKLNLPTYTNYSTASFGVSYESDRSYYLFTVTNTSDSYATQCFRYNTFTNSWTRFTLSKRCGSVNPATDQLFLSASDVHYLEQERKNFNRTDYADREYNYTLSGDVIDGNEIQLTSLTNLDFQDVLVQTQYLTIAQYNRLLMKLDSDINVDDSDYFSTLGAEVGDNLRSLLTSLATKLDADTGVADTNYAALISGYTTTITASNFFSDTQAAFNVIVNKLNLDSGVFYSNYKTSTGTIPFEVVITDFDTDNISIITEETYPIIQGPITIYKHIDSNVRWAPEHIQDPSLLKQMSEATLILEKTNFSQITLGFASDLDLGFEEIIHNGDGNGIFGSSVFGNEVYGGDGNNVPFRTYIPKNKQRCRYIHVTFNHGTARESYSIFGLSLTANQLSTRAYK